MEANDGSVSTRRLKSSSALRARSYCSESHKAQTNHACASGDGMMPASSKQIHPLNQRRHLAVITDDHVRDPV